MESSQVLTRPSLMVAEAQSWQERLIIKLLEKFQSGSIRLEFLHGNIWHFEGSRPGHHANLRIFDRQAFFAAIFKSGDIGLGESYVDAIWDTPDVVEVIAWAIDNIANNPFASGGVDAPFWVNLLAPINRLKHHLRRNSRDGSRQNIYEHYDLGNSFYSLWLDASMNYSSGIFRSHKDTLEQAQLNKMERICRQLDLQAGERVLEIGVGWGGLAAYMAKNYGVLVTGLTISNEQYLYCQERIERESLHGQVRVELCDYRDFKDEKPFDKIVSIEMIEAVGDQYIPDYFKVIDSHLAQDGLFLMQAITSPNSRYQQFKKGVDWIQKHIFPGSLLPSVQRLVEQANVQAHLDLANLHDMGLSYANTLKEWRQRFWHNAEKVDELIHNPEFKRKWHFYLCYCEAAFMKRNISDVQLLFTRPNNSKWRHEKSSYVR